MIAYCDFKLIITLCYGTKQANYNGKRPEKVVLLAVPKKQISDMFGKPKPDHVLIGALCCTIAKGPLPSMYIL